MINYANPLLINSNIVFLPKVVLKSFKKIVPDCRLIIFYFVASSQQNFLFHMERQGIHVRKYVRGSIRGE